MVASFSELTNNKHFCYRPCFCVNVADSVHLYLVDDGIIAENMTHCQHHAALNARLHDGCAVFSSRLGNKSNISKCKGGTNTQTYTNYGEREKEEDREFLISQKLTLRYELFVRKFHSHIQVKVHSQPWVSPAECGSPSSQMPLQVPGEEQTSNTRMRSFPKYFRSIMRPLCHSK